MKVAGVILAAGIGTRMRSPLPKVLHSLLGTPMLQYVVDTMAALKPEKLVVVVGRHADRIREAIRGPKALSFVEQREPRGTADALRSAAPVLRSFRGTVLVVNGDCPLLTPDTIRALLTRHRRKKNDLSFLSFLATNPASYGRVIRDGRKKVLSIVEEQDATAEQREIREVNSGVYALEPRVLALLDGIGVNPSKGEYYLTDVVHIARAKGMAVDAFLVGSEAEFIGINTPEDLERAGRLMRTRIVEHWRSRGVSFLDAGSVYISARSKLGGKTVVYPNVHIEGRTEIGSGCTIFPNVRIVDSTIGDGATVKDSTVIERSSIGRNASVGPFAHLRPGSALEEDVKIGNFVEVKNSRIGRGTKASHLSYLGDAEIGKHVNIGAGTITCNYDGYKKHVTRIEDGVFIGSDTQLIAPVKVSRGAVVGAGSTITADVPANALALSRVRQTNIARWAERRRKQEGRNQPKEKPTRK